MSMNTFLIESERNSLFVYSQKTEQMLSIALCLFKKFRYSEDEGVDNFENCCRQKLNNEDGTHKLKILPYIYENKDQ